MRGGETEPVWSGTADEPAPDNDAPADRVDLCIVGGGFTGLSAALHGAELGLSVQVLEAGGIGAGGSGRNVGLVNAGVWMAPAEVRRRLGEARGRRFLETFGAAPSQVFDLVERHQIRCAATRTGTIHAAHAPSGLADLEGRHADWRAAGAPVELLDRDQAVAATGSRAFHGGLMDARAGTVNPAAYARGLARAARGAGARVTTGLRAEALVRDGDGWRVDTARGAVRAKAVILAVNAYADTLWPGLSRSFTPIRFFQLATRPLGPEAAHILPGRQGLWDTGRIMRAMRRDAEGRLIVGAMGRLTGSARAGVSQRWAARQLARLFPELGRVEFETGWDGTIAMTPDHLPRIHAPAPGLWIPTGYNGRGITTGTVFGRALAEVVAGADPGDLPVPVTPLRRDRLAPLRAPFLDVVFAANQRVGAL